MAVSANSYFSDSICGQTNVGSDFDVFDSSTTPKYTVGIGFVRGDGAQFRYGHFGEIVGRGALVSTDVSESGATAIHKAGALTAALIKSGNSSMNNNAIGSRYAQLVITATADQFAGAYLTISSATGFGFTYHVRGNDATSATVASNTIMELYEPIQVALDSNSQISIAGYPYANLESSTTGDCTAIGVSVQNQSAGSYGWVQTHGIVSVLQDIAVGTIGKPCTVSSNTGGAISAYTAVQNSNPNYPLVGYLVEAGSSGGYSLVYLQLE